MTPDDALFEKIRILHTLEHAGNLLEITPFLEVESDRTATLIASFFVDSFEMIESARFSVEKGKNRIPFRQKVRIFNPLRWNPHTHGQPAMYELKTVFYKNGRSHHAVVKKTGLRLAELRKSGALHELLVNGASVPCVRHDFETDAGERRIAGLCRKYGFNFTVIRGSGDSAERLLAICDKLGIAAALDLSGLDSPERFADHPCVCLHTAETASRGAEGGTLPFLTLEQITKTLL